MPLCGASDDPDAVVAACFLELVREGAVGNQDIDIVEMEGEIIFYLGYFRVVHKQDGLGCLALEGLFDREVFGGIAGDSLVRVDAIAG